METCIFCKIVNHTLPSYTIYEDDDVIAFLDIKPYCDGHTLVVPKKHFTDYGSIDMETLDKLNKAAKRVYDLLNAKMKPESLQIIINSGYLQEVKHICIHLIPKFKVSKKTALVQSVYQSLIK